MMEVQEPCTSITFFLCVSHGGVALQLRLDIIPNRKQKENMKWFQLML